MTDIPKKMSFESEVSFGENKDGLREVYMKAYTGAVVERAFGQMIVNTKGLTKGRKDPKMLLSHDAGQPVGMIKRVIKGEDGLVETFGVLNGIPKYVEQVVASSDSGFAWEASIGFDIIDGYWLEEDKTKNINGREVVGPMYVVSKAKLNEVSFVTFGADGATSAQALEDIDIEDQKINKESEMAEEVKEEIAPEVELEKEEIEQTEEKLEEEKVELSDSEKSRVELSELKEAFKGELEFAVEAFENGLNVEQAKAKFADVLAIRLEEMKAEKEELIGKLEKATENKIDTGEGEAVEFDEAKTGPVSDDDLMQRFQAEGLSIAEAARKLIETKNK